MMDKLIAGYGAQLNEALEIAASAQLKGADQAIHNVLVAGMGGSGIGANLVQAFTADALTVPLAINKSYDLPAFVNQNTLFIACSYSGNTEETLAVTEAAHAAGARIVAITSGGKMEAFARQHGYDVIMIPGHSGSPRASIGYSYVQVLKVLNFYGLTASDYSKELAASAKLIISEQGHIQELAKTLAAAMKDRLPIVYADSKLEGVVLRGMQQIAENGKQLSHCNILPEMNHNELVGWMYAKNIFDNSLTVVLRTSHDHPRTAKRIDVCLEIFKKYSPEVLVFNAKGSSLVEQAHYFIHLLDWTSFYLAQENQVDPFPVEVIDYLKGQLAKF